VNVKFFGTLKDHVPGYDCDRGVDVVLDEGKSIRDLLHVLRLPETGSKLFLVRGLARNLTDELKDADEVNICLPIGRG
jgi:hypothetical protein